MNGIWFVALLLASLPVHAKSLDWPLVFVQESVAGAGSRIALLRPDGQVQVLTEGFAAAADPCVSSEGQRLLFAGKLKDSDPWEIWEMEADGSRKVKLTAGLGDCREPIYLARAAVDAPDFRDKVRWIAFSSTAPGVRDERNKGPLQSLYAMSLGPVPGRGTVVWRTTYDLGGDRSPSVLADGRVLFSSWQREGFALMTISWAGEDLNPFYGTHDGPLSQSAACELPDRTVVFIETEGEAVDQGGRLARVWLRRPLRTHQVLSQDAGRYRAPHPLPDGKLLVSYAPAEGGTWGIYLFDEKKGRPGRRLWDDPQWHDLDAQAVAPRPEPVGRIPMVEFASVLDVGELKGLGQLQCLNVYDSDRPEAGQIRPGQVKRVRLVEGLPLKPEEAVQYQPSVNPGGWPPPYIQTRPLGEAVVEEDGSFYVNVAGDVPFYIETLDGQGQVLQTMRAWTWVRSGDQRGCVGCHENKELAPENRATQALIRGEPATLAGPRR